VNEDKLPTSTSELVDTPKDSNCQSCNTCGTLGMIRTHEIWNTLMWCCCGVCKDSVCDSQPSLTGSCQCHAQQEWVVLDHTTCFAWHDWWMCGAVAHSRCTRCVQQPAHLHHSDSQSGSHPRSSRLDHRPCRCCTCHTDGFAAPHPPHGPQLCASHCSRSCPVTHRMKHTKQHGRTARD
jgi:hypothetical protein